MGKFHYNGIDLEIPESVYYPREDSLLIASVIEKTSMKGKNVLEIGCGSGFLSILIAGKGAKVTAVDINEEAVETTRSNAKANGAGISAVKSDLFENVSGRYDVIVFNPPYLPVEEGETDFTYAGGLSGRETIEKFILGAKDHLSLGGEVLIVISSLTGEKEVIDLFAGTGMYAVPVAQEKIPWEELIVVRASF